MSHGLGILTIRRRGLPGLLHIHRSERADRLVDALADVLAAAPADPFTPDVVSVHSRGIERWLAQELSARLGTAPGRSDGVAANIGFPFPRTLVRTALAAAVGAAPDADPWAPDRLVWPLLETLEERLDEPWLAPVARHLGRAAHPDPSKADRRFATARHLADLFDRYAVHRPAMVLGWEDRDDRDADGRPLDGRHAWQPELWRTLCARIPVPSTVARLADATARLRTGDVDPDLPQRLALFGLTALPRTYLDVLAALASHRDVHLLLLHPSPSLWDRVGAVLAELDGDVLRPRGDDPTASLPRHPLLASWGRDARELQLVAAAVARPTATVHSHPVEDATPATLLARLQAAIRGDDELPRRGHGDLPLLAHGDRSVRVHACHGRTRQVEVLRDAILHLLADDPTLEPRDIVVMCPDIETFAPLIEAVLGAEVDAPSSERPPDLRTKLADRAITQTNPVFGLVSALLDLADGRAGASEVLGLVARAPVRRRFRFDDDDLERIEDWVVGLGVRWGFDADHRARFGLEGVTANTWQAGLDRLLLGVAMADEELRTVGEVVPYDDVEGDDVDLAGRFAECVRRLERALDTFIEPRPILAWAAAIRDAADALAATAERDAWQRVQLDRTLDAIVDDATSEGSACEVPLSLAEVRSLLSGPLSGRPTRANHRTGDLTVCTLVPMRSVPHRVVCLLGMDDGAFPRRTAPDGDDLIGRAPHVGDRDPRTEDRQLLLDALLAASDHLVVTYTGRDERTNETRPPAVPIGELLDTIDRTVRAVDDDGEDVPASGCVVVEHPLQSFDPRNFTPDQLDVDGPWGFDPTELAGADALRGPRVDVGRFLAEPLGDPADAVVALDDLVGFLQHPVKAFLNRRLNVWLPSTEEEPSDAIPVQLSGLEQWGIGQRLLDAVHRGADPDRWAEVERARGTLPPGALADTVLDEVRGCIQCMREVEVELTTDAAPAPPRDLDIPLGDRRVVGTVGGLAGDAIVAMSYSTLRAKHRLGAWARLVALTAADPDTAWRSVTIGRSAKSAKSVAWSELRPLGATPEERRRTASDLLAVLVDLHDRGLREPLPVYCETSARYAELARSGSRTQAAEKAWETTFSRAPKEDADAHHVLVIGPNVTFEQLLEDTARADECGPGWYEDHPRLGRYALRLWEPLLAAEDGGDR